MNTLHTTFHRLLCAIAAAVTSMALLSAVAGLAEPAASQATLVASAR